MARIGVKGQKLLKGVHLFFVCAWIGAAMSMILLGLTRGHIANGDELYAVNASIKVIDDLIIIPAALGTLITGLLFSLLTNWGFVKHNWIIFKLIITVVQILFGTFFLGPWVNGFTAISDAERLQALQNAVYLYDTRMNMYWGSLQVLMLIFVVFISVYKPWGKRQDKKKA